MIDCKERNLAAGSGAEKAAAPDGEALHLILFRWNKVRLEPSFPASDWRDIVRRETELRLLEGEFLEAERRAIAARAAEAPESPDAFMEWFAELRVSGPGQGDRLFPWLAANAGLDEMKWFLSQEVAGEAGFDDLVAMTQIKLPARAKLELARNYWDEMGRGQAQGMHGALLDRTVAELGLRETPGRNAARTARETLWEPVALSNLMIGLAFNRHYAYHSVGALGAVEMTAPGRVSLVNAGLKRLGVSPAGRHYFSLHAGLDVKHSEGWNAEAIRPLIEANPWIAKSIAEGALMRLRAGWRCFERYRRHYGIA